MSDIIKTTARFQEAEEPIRQKPIIQIDKVLPNTVRVGYTETGRDNPFRPDGAIYKSADPIVDYYKYGPNQSRAQSPADGQLLLDGKGGNKVKLKELKRAKREEKARRKRREMEEKAEEKERAKEREKERKADRELLKQMAKRTHSSSESSLQRDSCWRRWYCCCCCYCRCCSRKSSQDKERQDSNKRSKVSTKTTTSATPTTATPKGKESKQTKMVVLRDDALTDTIVIEAPPTLTTPPTPETEYLASTVTKAIESAAAAEERERSNSQKKSKPKSKSKCVIS